MEIASVTEVAAFKSTGKAVIIDVRGRSEQESLGNAIDGNVNICFVDVDQFTNESTTSGLLPADKDTPIICH